MLITALVFLLLATGAAVAGLTGIAAAATTMAKIFFLVFLILWVMAGVIRALDPPDDET
ncbi:MAG: DUF1328 family protein [Pseudomonadota bacterium]